MRINYTRSRPCSIDVDGEEVKATMQLGYPGTSASATDAVGEALFTFEIADLGDAGLDPQVMVGIPIETLRLVVDAHDAEEQW